MGVCIERLREEIPVTHEEQVTRGVLDERFEPAERQRVSRRQRSYTQLPRVGALRHVEKMLAVRQKTGKSVSVFIPRQ